MICRARRKLPNQTKKCTVRKAKCTAGQIRTDISATFCLHINSLMREEKKFSQFHVKSLNIFSYAYFGNQYDIKII